MSDEVSILGYHPIPRSTKAEQFAGKILGLTEFYQRLSGNSGPLPSGKEVANYLKYFQQLLLSWVRDIQPHFDEDIREFNYSEFPTVDYNSLYHSLLLLMKVAKNVDSDVKEFTDGLLKTLSCLIPFLETDILLSTPMQLISCLSEMPNSAHSSVIDVLCSYIIPVTFGCMAPKQFPARQWVLSSTACILLNTLQFCQESGLWMKVIECLMTYTSDVRCYLLCVLAYGAQETAEPAIFLLNRYFPPLDIGSVKAYQDAPYSTMPSFKCQSISCPSNNSVNASKVCLDPGFCAEALNTPPPVYFCVLCVQTYCIANSPLCIDIIYPLGAVTDICENIKCTSQEKKAAHFCFDPDCIAKTQFRPMRLCTTCFRRLHDPGTEGERHITHQCLEDLWMMENPEQTYLVDAIGALLKEAEPIYQDKYLAMGVEYEINMGRNNATQDEMVYYKKISRSFHGLWLLRSLCHIPPSTYSFEHLGRLLAMLFSWTEAVAYIKHLRIGQWLKKVQEQANSWAEQVLMYDEDLYCSCLLPIPPTYARVGYQWEALMSKVHQLLEGMQKLATLLKFGLISEQVWERVMPHWMQEIKECVPTDEISKFVVILRNFFDSEQEFYPHYALNFIGKRLDSIIYRQKQEALVWIQMLSALEIQLDYEKLLEMFTNSAIDVSGNEGSTTSMFPFPDFDTLQSVAMSPLVQSPGASTPVVAPSLTSVSDGLSYYILVMDIIIKQMSLRAKGESGIGLSEENKLLRLLIKMLEETWTGEHSNHMTEECQQCRVMTIFFYQIHLLVEILVPKKIDRSRGRQKDSVVSEVLGPPEKATSTAISDEDNTTVHESVDGNVADVEAVIDNAFKPITSFESQDSDPEISNSIEDWRESVFRYADGFRHKDASVASAVSTGSGSSIWSAVLSANPELQVVEGLLKELQRQKDTAVLQHILNSLTVLLVRGDFLGVIKGEDVEFLYRIQNIFLIPSLWCMLESSNSQLAQSAVPLILYCISYAYGAERVSNEIESMFNNVSWRVRFSAVEKVALICQFMETEFVSESSLAQSTVVNGFAHLVSAADDVNGPVSERARTLLTSLKSSSLRCLYKYLELQFSQEPIDRLTILRTFRSIDQLMPDSSPLCGQFFLRLMKDVDVDPRQGSVVAGLLRTGSDSVASDIDTSSRASLISKTISSPSKSSAVAGTRRISLSRARPHSKPLSSYRRKYTLQFDRFKAPSFSDSRDDDDADGSYRRRRAFPYGPQLQKVSQASPLLGSRIQANLDTVTEESSESAEASEIARKRSSVSSTTSSVLSVQSDRSYLHQGPEKEVCHELIVSLIRFLADKKRCKEEKEFGLTTEKDLKNMTDHLGALMGYKGLFVVEPNELRQSTVFQAFLLNVPELLDSNDKKAVKFLPLCLAVMSYCLKECGDIADSSKDTLARLVPNLQYSWLMTLLILLYKYDFQTYREDVNDLIVITRNTLASSCHDRCRLGNSSSRLYRGNDAAPKERRKKFRNRKAFQKLGKHTNRTAKKEDGQYAPLGGKYESGGGFGDALEMVELSGHASFSSATTLTRQTIPQTPLDQPAADKVSSHLLTTITSKIKEDEKQISMLDVRICSKCGFPMAQFGEDIWNLCLVVLSTFVHRSPECAAHMLMEIFDTVGRIARFGMYLWEKEGCAILPGSSSGIARQFMRCTLLQLAPKGVFQEIFRSGKLGNTFFQGMVASLLDFSSLNEMKPLEYLFTDFTSRSDPGDRLLPMLRNLLSYLESLSREPVGPWKAQMHNFENFFKRLATALPAGEDLSPLMRIMSILVGLSKNLFKTLLPHFSQILTFIVKKAIFKLRDLQELCASCSDSFSKERDQLALTRVTLQETAMCMRMRHSVSNRNLKLLFQFAFLDAQSWFTFDYPPNTALTTRLFKMRSQAMKAIQVYTSEGVDFLKTWNYRFKGWKESPIDEESSQVKAFLILLKAAVGQIVALKLKDQIGASKVQGRILTWVRVSPQGGQHRRGDHVPEIVSHMRVLSWILLGALNHTVDTPGDPAVVYCIRLHDSGRIADYVEEVLLSYVDQELKINKKNVFVPLYMVFLLCEVWSVYCDSLARHKAQQEGNPIPVLVEFWGRVTFALLQLLQRGKAATELKTVTLFQSTLESLSACARQVFAELSSIWLQILEAYKTIIPESKVRKLRESQDYAVDKDEAKAHLKEWIGRTRTDLAAIEQFGRRRVDVNISA